MNHLIKRVFTVQFHYWFPVWCRSVEKMLKGRSRAYYGDAEPDQENGANAGAKEGGE